LSGFDNSPALHPDPRFCKTLLQIVFIGITVCKTVLLYPREFDISSRFPPFVKGDQGGFRQVTEKSPLPPFTKGGIKTV
jgi:hypothetical protein